MSFFDKFKNASKKAGFKIVKEAQKQADKIKDHNNAMNILKTLKKGDLMKFCIEYGIKFKNDMARDDLIEEISDSSVPINTDLVMDFLNSINHKIPSHFLTNISEKSSNKSRIFDEEEIKEKITIERETIKKVSDKEVSILTIRQVINNWKRIAPRATGRSKERQMTLSMTGYLASAFPEIILEQNLGGNRIDAVIGKIGIEAKYRPDQSEINRLYGQVDDYLRFLEHIVVVFFDTNQLEINNFKRKIDTGGYNEKVTIINV